GVFILAFVCVVVGGSLVLFALRGPGITGNVAPVAFSASSREGYLLANNVLMATAAGSVLLGTMYPLVLDTLELGKISVGPPYFEAVFFPVMAPAAFLMGIGPIARWRDAPLPELAVRLKWAFGIAVAATVLVALTSGRFGGEAGGSVFGAVAFASGVFLGLWLIAASLVAIHDRASQVKAPGWGARLRALPGGFWGMILAHAGVGVFCIGVACVKTLEVEIDAALGPGQVVKVRDYELRLTDLAEVSGPNYRAMRARVQVSKDGRALFDLLPEKRFYKTTQMVMTEAAIDSGLTRDLYVSLGEQLPDGRWTVKTWVKPFVDWIWAGCFMMAIGGFVAISDRRYRAARTAAATRGATAAA
ncbi:MAG: cytochrome c-type biogenesis CcmF C-terminal domain-containing protein, partial [Burkholderiales bacterium]